MSDRQVQVNIRLAENSADRLKALAESAGLKIGAFVERLIATYSADSSLLQNDSKAVQWKSVADELRGLIGGQEKRLNALEMAVMSAITDSSGKTRITVQPADLAPVEADNDDASPHPADSLPTAPSLADYERQIDEKIIGLRKEGLAIKKIQAALRIGQKRVCKAIKEAGLE